jgi:predicted DNA-binding transcriptional regulator AlpA
MAEAINDHTEYLTEGAAATILHLSRRTLQHYRLHGTGPRFLRLSARTIRFKRDDLDAWLNARAFNSTSEYENRPAA